MKKRIHRIVACVMILCCAVSFCHCGILSEGCEEAAEKYVEAAYGGDVENLLKYSVANIKEKAFVKACVAPLEDYKDQEMLEQRLLAKFGTTIPEHAYYGACNKLKQNFEEYNLTYSAIKSNHYSQDDAYEIISEFNDDVNDCMRNHDGDYKEAYSALLIDHDDVDSVCEVMVDIEGISELDDDVIDRSESLLLVKINGKWRVMDIDFYESYVEFLA